MPSRSLTTWNTIAQAQLDEIEAAHKAVGGQAPGRRYATQQINQAFAVMLSSQFQAFSRAFHAEAAHHLVSHLSPPAFQDAVHTSFTTGRKLDHGNPNPSHLGADFGRFGIDFWSAMRGTPEIPRVVQDQRLLEDLNLWRNAIAHQDFASKAFLARFQGKTTLQIATVRGWRAACSRLALRMDRILASHIQQLAGHRPW